LVNLYRGRIARSLCVDPMGCRQHCQTSDDPFLSTTLIDEFSWRRRLALYVEKAHSQKWLLSWQHCSVRPVAPMLPVCFPPTLDQVPGRRGRVDAGPAAIAYDSPVIRHPNACHFASVLRKRHIPSAPSKGLPR
jgi:hypothetical protein